MKRILVVLLCLVWLASCADDAPRERQRPAPNTGDEEAQLAREMLEEYTGHMNALLDELERIAPLQDEEGDASLAEVQDIRAAIEAHLAALEAGQSGEAKAEEGSLPPARSRGPSEEEMARLRREAAAARDARAQVKRVTAERTQLQRSLDETQEELDAARARAEELAAHAEAYVIALPRGGLAAMRKQGHLRRQSLTSATYEPTSQILPIGATGKTIVGVDVSAKSIFLGERVSGARVVSVHRDYEDLFSIQRRQGQLAVVIKNPTAFWRISRYLIVEVE